MVNRVGIYGSKVAEGISVFQCRSCYLNAICEHMCTFRFWMVHCGIWNGCIVRFLNLMYYIIIFQILGEWWRWCWMTLVEEKIITCSKISWITLKHARERYILLIHMLIQQKGSPSSSICSALQSPSHTGWHYRCLPYWTLPVGDAPSDNMSWIVGMQNMKHV